ncbi:DsbA family oxidoreductase [Streptomyces sp. NBC_00237]|uniref:DsbA family oxidoreductase n=1 Tax=Streptomyces sp. NBC_00237 TaxID=2975687 RepID=UPI00224DF347|nr:DsbA family oxidoreductase [Streptomyces sp. NBC_00237]MCX5203226.1 DsbA family oxidoreductase [Streptomyces sp. NBC_00237]
MTTSQQPVRIDMTLDVICAASYIGYTRLAKAAVRHRASGGKVEFTFSPFQLAPDATGEGEPLLDALRELFGDAAAAHTTQIAADALRDGLELNYERAIATGTFEAHHLVAVAEGQGKGEAAVERLFRAHFTDGLNIGDPAVLATLADELGVTVVEPAGDALRAELDRVRALGVRGVPVFTFNGGPAVTGALSEEAYLQILVTSSQGSVN